jgi:hypothetical protein
MRRKLKEMEEKRCTFSGTFKRIGYKPGYKGHASTMTVLIVNVKNKKGKFITDHTWLNYTKGLQELNLSKGDEIEFKARVKEYKKGSKGNIDYKLSHPSQIKKIPKTESGTSITLRKNW